MTPKARYGAIMDDLQMIGTRNMLCGMHVHVEVPDVDTRINLIMRLTPYLPLLLALSTSSPFWQGHLTGLVGYRLAAYDELPRTGLPELFRTNEDYDEFVAALVGAKIIPDASYIWWAMRPSLQQSDHRAARRRQLHAARRRGRDRRAVPLPGARARSRPRAQCRLRPRRPRHHARRTNGTPSATASPPPSSIRSRARRSTRRRNGSMQVFELIAEDIAAFGCEAEIAHLDRIVAQGTSADRQIDIFRKSQRRRPATVNGDQGGRRLGGRRDQARGLKPRLRATALRASPCAPGHL